MVDERFDVMHGARLWWWRRKGMVRIGRSAGAVVDALLDNPEALAHLLDVYGRTIVTVARAANRYIELELVVAGIGLFLAKIPIETARAQVWTCHSPLNCFFDGAASNTLRARFEQTVAHHSALVLVEPGRQVVQEVSEQAVPSAWQVLGHTTNAEPVGVHAGTADRFNNSKPSAPLLYLLKNRRPLAQVP